MSYNFKSLGEVELLNTMPETANVFVEVDGGIRRAPQVKVDVSEELVNKETLEEVPEGATVLAEVDGEIKRVPSKGLGGGDAWDILISVDSNYENPVWVKGDYILLADMLIAGQPPRICIYWTNGDTQYPEGFYYSSPKSISFNSGSGSWANILFASDIELSVSLTDGYTNVYYSYPT